MKPKKILLTGVGGQMGYALQPALSEFQVVGLTRKELDLTDEDAIRRIIREIKPDLIINPAAYTAVDKAESEPELANAVNVNAPRTIAEEAAEIGAALIHFSTDYVYDGTKTTPYIETDLENPTSVYGSSKLAGENAIREVGLPHLILRISWVYGTYGQNFLKTILRKASTQNSLNVVADQFGAPTSSRGVANAMYYLITQWNPQQLVQTGIYHISNSGQTSWHGFAREIISQYIKLNKLPVLKAGIDDVFEVKTAEYPTAATRPINSCLDNSKLALAFGVTLPSWQQGLKEVMLQL